MGLKAKWLPWQRRLNCLPWGRWVILRWDLKTSKCVWFEAPGLRLRSATRLRLPGWVACLRATIVCVRLSTAKITLCISSDESDTIGVVRSQGRRLICLKKVCCELCVQRCRQKLSFICYPHHTRSILHTQLTHDVLTVRVNGLIAYVKLIGYFFSSVLVGDQVEDFLFSSTYFYICFRRAKSGWCSDGCSGWCLKGSEHGWYLFCIR